MGLVEEAPGAPMEETERRGSVRRELEAAKCAELVTPWPMAGVGVVGIRDQRTQQRALVSSLKERAGGTSKGAVAVGLSHAEEAHVVATVALANAGQAEAAGGGSDLAGPTLEEELAVGFGALGPHRAARRSRAALSHDL